MDQPVYWALLSGAAVLAGAARLAVRRPLWPGRAVPVDRTALAVAVVGVLVLAFHCASMFFAPWTDALPAGRALGAPVRELGTVSQLTYWAPAAALVLAVRRVWWPGVVLLAGTLAGVGATMFRSAPLPVHLTWLAAAVLAVAFVGSALVGLRGADRPSPAVPG
ncbi:hypothetical protein [Modestobacter sp. URMC 112]